MYFPEQKLTILKKLKQTSVSMNEKDISNGMHLAHCIGSNFLLQTATNEYIFYVACPVIKRVPETSI